MQSLENGPRSNRSKIVRIVIILLVVYGWRQVRRLVGVADAAGRLVIRAKTKMSLSAGLY